MFVMHLLLKFVYNYEGNYLLLFCLSKMKE